mmetsp:Transcript_60140/g.130431  ORF Transcript_60140/g.130431 Transcript_60140/m.130431 type:complete len:368 (-) Transcript_60140:103-1206(-)
MSSLAATKSGSIRRSAFYCTPHAKLPGTLLLSSRLVRFVPDERHVLVREFGTDECAVRVEVRDIAECAAVVGPLQAGDVTSRGDLIGYFLQLRVRTLDGLDFCDAEDLESAWCVVFQMRDHDQLYEVARLLLASQVVAASGPSSTRVPFPSVDCAVVFEAVSGRIQPLAELPDTYEMEQVTLRHDDVARPLLAKSLAECIFDYLPVSVRVPGATEWVLSYTPKVHGVSLTTMFRNVGKHSKTVLVVQDSQEYIFGGFAPEPWEPQSSHFYGTGEAFVFSFGRVVEGTRPTMRAFPWTSKNSYFMYSDYELIAMGGGDGRHAVSVFQDLLHGHSSPTETFGNSILAGTEDFIVRDLEIWALEEVDASP